MYSTITMRSVFKRASYRSFFVLDGLSFFTGGGPGSFLVTAFFTLGAPSLFVAFSSFAVFASCLADCFFDDCVCFLPLTLPFFEGVVRELISSNGSI